eukprot:767105-Hanusia_phi.AAC.1
MKAQEHSSTQGFHHGGPYLSPAELPHKVPIRREVQQLSPTGPFSIPPTYDSNNPIIPLNPTPVLTIAALTSSYGYKLSSPVTLKRSIPAMPVISGGRESDLRGGTRVGMATQ